MDGRIVISCGMLMDEVKHVCEKINEPVRIVWMKRAMHKKPALLARSLQQLIDEHQQEEAILLTYGLCGNSTPGLVSRCTKLVIPRFHDCIHQLLAQEASFLPGHYYLTRGWVQDREEPCQQCRLILSKYGEEDGREIISRMYDGYTDIDVIDTGAYPIDEIAAHAGKCAELLSARINRVPGSTVVLEKLLTGDWDDDFIVLEPGEELKLSHFLDHGM